MEQEKSDGFEPPRGLVQLGQQINRAVLALSRTDQE
jgi:hypothetical protein